MSLCLVEEHLGRGWKKREYVVKMWVQSVAPNRRDGLDPVQRRLLPFCPSAAWRERAGAAARAAAPGVGERRLLGRRRAQASERTAGA